MKSFVKRLVRNAIRRHGWDLVKGPTLNDFLRLKAVDLVLDVGAGTGEYGRMIRRWGYSGDIFSLEPTRRWAAELEVAAQKDGRWKSRNAAAGDAPGRASLNVSRESGFSSFLKLSDYGAGFDARTVVERTEDVEVITLDSLKAELAPYDRIFLKIDTQGFEESVLRGAAAVLDKCVGVQLELPAFHLYEGVWSMAEAVGFMADRGFAMAQVTPVNTSPTDLACAVEFDCVFRRSAAHEVAVVAQGGGNALRAKGS